MTSDSPVTWLVCWAPPQWPNPGGQTSRYSIILHVYWGVRGEAGVQKGALAAVVVESFNKHLAQCVS
jgi:hypothetical protein